MIDLCHVRDCAAPKTPGHNWCSFHMNRADADGDGDTPPDVATTPEDCAEVPTPWVDHYDPTDATRIDIPEGASSLVVEPAERTVLFERNYFASDDPVISAELDQKWRHDPLDVEQWLRWHVAYELCTKLGVQVDVMDVTRLGHWIVTGRELSASYRAGTSDWNDGFEECCSDPTTPDPTNPNGKQQPTTERVIDLCHVRDCAAPKTPGHNWCSFHMNRADADGDGAIDPEFAPGDHVAYFVGGMTSGAEPRHAVVIPPLTSAPRIRLDNGTETDVHPKHLYRVQPPEPEFVEPPALIERHGELVKSLLLGQRPSNKRSDKITAPTTREQSPEQIDRARFYRDALIRDLCNRFAFKPDATDIVRFAHWIETGADL